LAAASRGRLNGPSYEPKGHSSEANNANHNPATERETGADARAERKRRDYELLNPV
jgi:hypothetical protein